MMTKELDILKMSEEAVLQYLHETDRPEWTFLRMHPGFTEKWPSVFLARTRPIPKEAVLDLYKDRIFRKNYRINLDILRCKGVPTHLAMNLIPTFRWLDLLMTLRRPFLAGPVRRGIEDRLMEMIPEMPLGEKISVARQAPRSMIRHLRVMPEQPVIRALLTNPSFTFDDAMFLSHYPRITPGTLEELAKCARWRSFAEIRKAIIRHPRTPRFTLYPLALTLSAFDLQQILKNKKISPFTRDAVRRVLRERNQKI